MVRECWQASGEVAEALRSRYRPEHAPSMLSALTDLQLDRLLVIYPGAARYALSECIEALPLVDAIATLSKLS